MSSSLISHSPGYGEEWPHNLRDVDGIGGGEVCMDRDMTCTNLSLLEHIHPLHDCVRLQHAPAWPTSGTPRGLFAQEIIVVNGVDGRVVVVDIHACRKSWKR